MDWKGERTIIVWNHIKEMKLFCCCWPWKFFLFLKINFEGQVYVNWKKNPLCCPVSLDLMTSILIWKSYCKKSHSIVSGDVWNRFPLLFCCWRFNVCVLHRLFVTLYGFYCSTINRFLIFCVVAMLKNGGSRAFQVDFLGN